MSDPEPREDSAEAGRTPPLHSATLPCENCREETAHRILRFAPTTRAHPRSLSGTARCRKCGWTHRFTVASPSLIELSVVVSRGPSSEHRRIEVPSLERVEVGGSLPGSEEPLLVQKIDARSGHSVSSARPEEVATVWATRDVGAIVPVSVVEGATTWTDRLVLPRESRLTIGDPILVRGHRVRIVALRARGRTWRLSADGFSADEVERVYARRTETPPAGRRPWRMGRGIPRVRASSTSTSPRSRSGPGTRRARRSPRERTADGGAAIHRVSPR